MGRIEGYQPAGNFERMPRGHIGEGEHVPVPLVRLVQAASYLRSIREFGCARGTVTAIKVPAAPSRGRFRQCGRKSAKQIHDTVTASECRRAQTSLPRQDTLMIQNTLMMQNTLMKKSILVLR